VGCSSWTNSLGIVPDDLRSASPAIPLDAQAK
jgi:hypothetical protein